MKHDLIVIGAGFCGSILARKAADRGRRVLLVERRGHIAGNMYDERVDGILVHRYGPHTFHTNDEEVWNYVRGLTEWTPYELRCGAYFEGKFTPTPFNYQTIDDYNTPEKAAEIKRHIEAAFPGAEQATILELLDHPDDVVRGWAEFLFERDYRPYTCKQWGIEPNELDKSVLRRVPVVFSYRDGYFTDRHQVMPRHGFTALFEGLLRHPLITVRLHTEALGHLKLGDDGEMFWDGERLSIPVVCTGPIDELFGARYGSLPYRSLRFEGETLPQRSFQPAAVVAYPEAPGYTRIVEYTKLPDQDVGDRTRIVREYPSQYVYGAGIEPYYPVPSDSAHATLALYQQEARRYPLLFLGGRLADYRYYNMDQVVRRALEVWGGLETAL